MRQTPKQVNKAMRGAEGMTTRLGKPPGLAWPAPLGLHKTCRTLPPASRVSHPSSESLSPSNSTPCCPATSVAGGTSTSVGCSTAGASFVSQGHHPAPPLQPLDRTRPTRYGIAVRWRATDTALGVVQRARRCWHVHCVMAANVRESERRLQAQGRAKYFSRND